MYRELLELKFKRKVPLISAGTSIALPLLRDGQLPACVNHFRIGESAFIGTDLLNGDSLAGLRDDAFTLEVEVVEVKEKSMAASGETNGMMPFRSVATDAPEPGERGYRAITTIGQLDTDVSELTPLDPNHRIVGASSDMTVVSLGANDGKISVGESIKFRPSYGALVRLMLDKYVDKVVTPSVERFTKNVTDDREVDLPPVITESIKQLKD
ncbi:MAG: hypothetical protein KDB53_06365, partial [Planctomycetes bacterium]|nr:hypothetical protein [Planctomycetota bacterium]